MINPTVDPQDPLIGMLARLAAAVERYTADHDFERVMTADGDNQAVALLQSGWKVVHVQSVDPWTDRQKDQNSGQVRIMTIYVMGLPRQRAAQERAAVMQRQGTAAMPGHERVDPAPSPAGQIAVPQMAFRRPVVPTGQQG